MTTKVCPKCSRKVMVELRSTNEKICNDCKAVIPWHLDPGQKPTFTSHRKDRENTPNTEHQ